MYFDKFTYRDISPRKLDKPKPSKFKSGDMVRWGHPAGYPQSTVDEYRAKYGNGPFVVLSTTDATEEFIPPQVRVITDRGTHTFGETWFVRVPNIGETCEVCHHTYEKRTLFFSVDEQPSCWCK